MKDFIFGTLSLVVSVGSLLVGFLVVGPFLS